MGADRRTNRDALVVALIGDPGADLPHPATLDRTAFWHRFDATAPPHLALGVRVATAMLAVALPRLTGHRHGLADLAPADAQRVIARAARTPGLDALCEVAKVVACFAYFADPAVDAAVRGTSS